MHAHREEHDEPERREHCCANQRPSRSRSNGNGRPADRHGQILRRLRAVRPAVREWSDRDTRVGRTARKPMTRLNDESEHAIHKL